MARNMSQTDTERPVVTTTNRARSAVAGQGVRYVLSLSLLAVVLIFAGLWFFYFGH